MLIELKEPFKNRWNKGYLQTHKDGRKNVHLYNSSNDRTTISYARYLMCVHLGYILSADLEVDHKNDDKTDDGLENLQVLTKLENIHKQHMLRRGFIRSKIPQTCCICEDKFFHVKDRNTCGDRNCYKEFRRRSAIKLQLYGFSVGKNYNYKPKHALKEEQLSLMAELKKQGLSKSKVAKSMGLSNTTVGRRWSSLN